MNNQTICRPRARLDAIGRRFPGAWAMVDEFRADRGKAGLPDWPEWCFLPIAGSYAIVSSVLGVSRLGLEHMNDVACLATLTAWRVTQGIYRFDPAVYDAVRETPIDREIPCEVLYRLPEWCVYIETPDMQVDDAPMYGAFAHLEHDANDGRAELRLLLDVDERPIPVPLHLGQWSLEESIQRAVREAQTHRNILDAPSEFWKTVTHETQGMVTPIVSLLLYLCSQAAEIGNGARQPGNPKAKNVRGQWRIFQADKPTTWDVGVRMGSALRAAYAAQEIGAGRSHAGPRGHVRRAHWHTILSGQAKHEDGTNIPAADRTRTLRWLPPIAVNLPDVAALPATIHPVRATAAEAPKKDL